MIDHTTAASAAPKTEFLDGPAPRTTTVPLKWPVVIDGTTYREVTIRRINGREARDYYAATMATLTRAAPAMVYPGFDLPQSVWDQFDDDDVVNLDQAVEAFLPERFAPLTALLKGLAGLADGEGEASTGAAPKPRGGLNLEHGAS